MFYICSSRLAGCWTKSATRGPPYHMRRGPGRTDQEPLPSVARSCGTMPKPMVSPYGVYDYYLGTTVENFLSESPKGKPDKPNPATLEVEIANGRIYISAMG